MSSGRSVVFAGVVLLLATGALVAMALMVNEPRPVDVRRVDLNPAEPGVLSATYTTTIEAARPTTSTVVVLSPVRRPAPPVVTTTEPTVSSASIPESTTSSTPPGEKCDPAYVTNGVCVPWHPSRGVWQLCEWLREQGVTRVEVQGPDHLHLDLDLNGIACELVA